MENFIFLLIAAVFLSMGLAANYSVRKEKHG